MTVCGDFVATPWANRGSDCQTQHVSTQHNLYYHQDWLTVSVWVRDDREVENLLRKYFDTSVDWSAAVPGIRGHGWQAIAKSPNGIAVCKNFHDEGVWEMRIELPGSVITQITGDEAWELCKEFRGMDGKCNRFDWAIDDYAKALRLEDIREAGKKGAFSKVEKILPREVYHSGGSPKMTGFTCGSRQSDKYVRIYDKGEESRGTANYVDCIRYEAEFKGDYADKLFQEFCAMDTVEEAFNLASAYAVGCVEFYEERKVAHLDRNQPAQWWEKFLEAVGGAKKMSVPRIKQTVSRIINYHQKQVARGIALLEECKGVEWVERHVKNLIHRGKKGFGRKEKIFVDAFHAGCKRPVTRPSLRDKTLLEMLREICLQSREDAKKSMGHVLSKFSREDVYSLSLTMGNYAGSFVREVLDLAPA